MNHSPFLPRSSTERTRTRHNVERCIAVGRCHLTFNFPVPTHVTMGLGGASKFSLKAWPRAPPRAFKGTTSGYHCGKSIDMGAFGVDTRACRASEFAFVSCGHPPWRSLSVLGDISSTGLEHLLLLALLGSLDGAVTGCVVVDAFGTAKALGAAAVSTPTTFAAENATNSDLSSFEPVQAIFFPRRMDFARFSERFCSARSSLILRFSSSRCCCTFCMTATRSWSSSILC
mmetsp:Transcript_101611/g.294039  ORF Transcript_101611/g.294039 Transcript_101611/m.294039 type:complete len:230 (-) Transcript_101611:649-1338(-)